MTADDLERHSRALNAELVTNPEDKARAEARNGLHQFDKVMEMVDFWLEPERPFRLRASALLHLNRAALEGINSYAGNYRPAGVEIGGSKHQPCGAYLVPEEVEHMCDYVNENWNKQTAIHLAAYVLWRLNWIHPFTDGNGRTARALSYLVLCVRLGDRLPGRNAIPELIARDKRPYYLALEAADAASSSGTINLMQMEKYLENLLAQQLVSVHEAATGHHIGKAPDRT